MQAAQEAIRWAEHLVFVYPIWWGTMPALLKGFLDRAFVPGFACCYYENSIGWERCLAGRSARLIVTMDAPPWYFHWVYGKPGYRAMEKTVLYFCGMKPVRGRCLGSVRHSSAGQRERWLAQGRQDNQCCW